LPSSRNRGALLHEPDEAVILPASALAGLMTDVFARGGSFRFTARGHSMHPFIRNGDVVTVSPLGARSPVAGDVVAFRGPEHTGLALHRIRSRQGDRYLAQGDNCRDPDGLIPGRDLLGVVTAAERAGRSIRLGLGPERRLLALLARLGVLAPGVRAAATVRRRVRGR
jgi:hypothetical protein